MRRVEEANMKYNKIDDAPRFNPSEGIEIAIMGDGENVTVTRITFTPGPRVVLSEHSHHNEQIGTCIEGKATLVSGGVTLNVEPGMTWTIPPNEVHRFEPKGEDRTVILAAFSPPREDYKARAQREQ